MPTFVKIIILVVLIVVLLLFYYVVPDSSGVTPAQKKAGIQPYQLAGQNAAKKPGVDVGKLIGGILGILQAAGKFIADAVKGAKGKTKSNTKSESNPYGGKYDVLDKLNVGEMFNQSLDNNSLIGGYTQSNSSWFFGDIFAGGSGSGGATVSVGTLGGGDMNTGQSAAEYTGG